jgi:hypothetical protein
MPYGGDYGYDELKMAIAIGDLTTDGTADNYGSLYGYKELRLAIAIAEQLRGSPIEIGNGSSSGTFNGNRQITRQGFPSITPGGSTVVEFLNNLFFPAISPGASISITPSQKEFGEGAEVTIDWTATRKTRPIISISVAGQTISPTGETQSGVISSLVNPNANTTFSILVSDGNLISNGSTTLTWMNRRYWGRIPKNGISQPITDGDILSLDGAGVGGGNELAFSRQKDYSGINGAGQFLIFAFPSAWGDPVFTVQRFPFSAITKVRDNLFTNKFGFQSYYQIWITNTIQFEPLSQLSID